MRKPLKENLFYFEWLLADSADFIDRFHAPLPNKENGKRPLPQPMQLSKEKRIEIIRKALQNSELGEWASPQFIYELRYDKDAKYGLEGLFQRANHLITTFTAQTEEQNFNFVFSGDEDRLSQWRGMYITLPVLLLHTVLVIGAVINSFAEDKLVDFAFIRLRAIVGFLLYIQNSPWKDAEFNAVFEGFLDSFSKDGIPCLGCGELVRVDSENLHSLYEEGAEICRNCGYKSLLTSRKELLMAGHLLQRRINCPACNSVVVGSKENVDSIISTSRKHKTGLKLNDLSCSP